MWEIFHQSILSIIRDIGFKLNFVIIIIIKIAIIFILPTTSTIITRGVDYHYGSTPTLNITTKTTTLIAAMFANLNQQQR